MQMTRFCTCVQCKVLSCGSRKTSLPVCFPQNDKVRSVLVLTLGSTGGQRKPLEDVLNQKAERALVTLYQAADLPSVLNSLVTRDHSLRLLK